MNRKRLEEVRDTVRGLRAIADRRSSIQQTATSAADLTGKPGELPEIDTLDMRVLHTRHEHLTAGCITGITLTLYPKTAVRLADEEERRHGRRPPPQTVAARILGIEGQCTHPLLCPQPHIGRYVISPAQAARAIDRVLAGESPLVIWSHAR